ncbi:ribosomal protein S18 acetylase RimI-like enzyme [Microbacterium paludicola]|uniref:Ribosomal protein S18 acetylase RimI-like enzyme n=1 Tax=Microbacterium paludicola TaxID=300019 RepID=A0ABU1I3P3_9MICO|nr:GNAT family N-acetyltransferase [Microbacterium paludicola]MDR6168508.1 ribosomal protein S18 acetylase RimI-like enzyme [Microbacterium paludicola]
MSATVSVSLRPAGPDDLPAVRELDRLCFPPGRDDVEPAHPGELESALAGEQITLAVIGDSVVGMLQTERLGPEHVYLAALAVHPDHQRTGIGARLVRHFSDTVKGMSPRPSATTVTSPRNVAMIDLLTRSGFVGSRGIHAYFGPSKDRLYFQLKSRQLVADPDDRVLVPVAATDHLFDLLSADANAVTSVIKSVQGTFFEVSTFEVEDRPGLRADETSVSTGEAGAVLAALTFLLGFSLTITDFSEALRIFLLVATILTLGATQVYANASGSLSRLQDDQFGLHMKWGNLLLEFGGVYPLVLVLPAVFADASDNAGLSLATAIVVAVLVLAYEVSPFSISGRYRRNIVFYALAVVTAAAPVAAAPLQALTGRDTAWVVLTAVILIVRLAYLIPAGRQELGARTRPRLMRRARRTR